MRASAYAATLERFRDEAGEGRGPSNGVSVLKNLWSGIAQERAELEVEILGSQGLGWGDDSYADEERAITRHWLHSKAYSIYGGSYEVQNNITAKRSLGLPDA
jgi:alkylation response protein AidB-like acyl-CoA dehydrogenase